ncbi:3d86c3c1-0fe7-420e-8cc6-da0d9fbf655f [Thermothielavioides terrestris]|uniref:3d86c3c1-0fe7-420e-8cc6-da0d9fbf655f n=1 Tax=Thermothielavioides terrestris TaxID=2587410 RepID=A0A446BAU0_9PEZI|nr:3d86c3c1-0fe7-420e-8cc6-da0d9fbf655f [Thermothielavioides terrestris]
MSDTVSSSGPDALEEALGRLSKKAGVRATIVLDRASGTILKTSGQISSIRSSKASGSSVPAVGSFPGEANGNNNGQDQGAEELASMVWNFVTTAGSFVQELDAEDEVKLLRLRTKKQEFVIVPDAKYLLIVAHDTSSA